MNDDQFCEDASNRNYFIFAILCSGGELFYFSRRNYSLLASLEDGERHRVER